MKLFALCRVVDFYSFQVITPFENDFTVFRSEIAPLSPLPCTIRPQHIRFESYLITLGSIWGMPIVVRIFELSL